MPTRTKNKGARQQAVRRARIAAAAEASRRQDRRTRWLIVAGAGVLIAAVVLGTFVTRSVSGKTKVAAGSSTADQQCVAMTDTPPPGAPYVPVQVGPAPTQLVTKELRGGTGDDAVQPGDSVTVQYVGVNCRDGKIFDSSWNQGHPVSFKLDDVIKGWQEGIPGMKVGEQRLLGIPPDQAYGEAGRPGIEPNATLWFVVDLVNINAHASSAAPGSEESTVPATTPPPVSS
ncbi:MAG TPA: FKBP-type peptidyl-prolyl cis-trans isomerase [Acidimicrobiales bacterium]|nr:FKBP-type peptidyl-prolyl cis-trans isomerase [Acidimicrobiales bacterium]